MHLMHANGNRLLFYWVALLHELHTPFYTKKPIGQNDKQFPTFALSSK
jgi:hypothetical protein